MQEQKDCEQVQQNSGEMNSEGQNHSVQKLRDMFRLLPCKQVVACLWFPVSLFYLEIVLAAATGGLGQTRSWFYLAIFSCSYGMVVYGLASLIKQKKVLYIVQAVLLFLISAIYIAQYLLYCQFRIFYDFNTMFAGATDAVSDFSGDIISIMVSEDGLWHIALFLFPFVLYLFVGFLFTSGYEKRIRSSAVLLAGAVLAFGLGVCAVCTPEDDRNAFLVDYNYQASVQRFGMLTGLGMEVAHLTPHGKAVVAFDLAGEAQVSAEEQNGAKKQNERDENLTAEESKDVALTDQGERAQKDGGAAHDAVDKQDVADKKAAASDKKLTNKSGEKEAGGSDKKTGKKSKNESGQNAFEETASASESGKNQIDIDFEALHAKKGTAYAELDAYVQAQRASSKNEFTGLFKGKNLIFITAEAFTAEVIDRDRTPTLYRLATRGMQFTDYYQPASAGTTGGEYANLFGMLPTAGGSSVKKTQDHYNWSTMASRLSEEGYYGKAFHNHDYTYYDRHKTHVNLGFSDGFTGKGNGLEEVITPQWPESDLEMMKGTFSTYLKKEPFYIYYMSVSGHSLYTFGKNAMAKKHRDEVADLPYSEPVQAYLAGQQEFEAALSYLVGQLERLHMADDTVIVISSDHFPYGLDQDSGELKYLQELYGQKVEDSLYRDHNRLIIWSGCLEDEAPIVVDSPTSSIDILPTLCNLFGVRFDSRLLPGRDVFSDAEPLVFDLGYDFKTDKGTYIAAKGKFTEAPGVAEVSKEYISRIQTIVRNKITYSKAVLNEDYFRYLFEDKEKLNANQSDEDILDDKNVSEQNE